MTIAALIRRAGDRRAQIRERLVEIRIADRRAIGERDLAERCLAWLAQLDLAYLEVGVHAIDGDRVAQATHDYTQREVHDVVARAAAIRKTGEIVAGDTERALHG